MVNYFQSLLETTLFIIKSNTTTWKIAKCFLNLSSSTLYNLYFLIQKLEIILLEKWKSCKNSLLPYFS